MPLEILFCLLGPLIAQRWTAPLRDMYDVAFLRKHYDRLRFRTEWVPAAMFFVLHQLRYSILQSSAVDRFIAFLQEYRDLPDDMLEPKLRTCIAETVIPNLLTLWDSRRDSASWKLEHEQVPPQAKKWMGMATLGV